MVQLCGLISRFPLLPTLLVAMGFKMQLMALILASLMNRSYYCYQLILIVQQLVLLFPLFGEINYEEKSGGKYWRLF
jgi:hypothetical protein